MKRALILLIWTSFLSPLWADEPVKGSGRAFFGVASFTDEAAEPLLHVGGGGEGQIAGKLGVTADLGYLAALDGLSGGIGVFSPGLIYHFGERDRTMPFANGGYTLLFREDTLNYFFAGAGLDHWFSQRTGLRVEFRVHGGDLGLVEGRFSFLFR